MYQLPKLTYLYQDLEPFIDTNTMGLHYHKHDKTYLNNLNKILSNYDYKYNIDELIYHIDSFKNSDKPDILFNLGGVLNHDLYFKSMSNYNILPYGKLKEKIDSQYKNYENFWIIFKQTALKLKGSGYTFLVLKNNKDLDVINISNQDIPLLQGYIPLFNIDLWEHAYYLNYKNDKSKYIDNFKLVADFKNASEIYNNLININKNV